MTISLNNPGTNTSDLITLARWMAGDFSNQKQTFENPKQYAHIHVFFRPFPFEFFSGIGFYSEQVYDYDLWTPYRQGIHRLIDNRDHIHIENYSLKDPVQYAGAARELTILQTINHDSIERHYCCSMVFKRQGKMFQGGVEPGNKCLIPRNGHQTYLISEVELTENTWNSLDKGMDIETHEQIWGSTAGPLCFEKKQSFADEVTDISVGE
ncbi:chromophore lyase CpcT/CpeT [Brunnivagina elsteri]|uniref:Chromophore lyase CpcT/CpeT n=1 Tax=Brunnivagina elsteri CCALA 953 TaxID=987040 RepID=A0A2A2TGS9_9CYAN|nr:chromophore lyase CpcT/CpeT [Calothrix elsteri]PAX52891.1 chorismate-binding protein [Calothrix elsteri CCALA 953]